MTEKVGGERLENMLNTRLECLSNELKDVPNNTLRRVLKLSNLVLQYAKRVRTPLDVMEKRADNNRSANEALEEWKRACSYKIEQNKRGVRGCALGIAMKVVMQKDNRSKKIPWAYYDFHNQQLNYSPAALELLKIGNSGNRVFLTSLLRYIKKEDRREVIRSLDSGEGLKHFETATSKVYNGKSRRLILSTFPHYYSEEEVAIGAAIFLRDPKVSLHSRGIHQFEKYINEVAQEVFEQLKGYEEVWK